MSEKSDALPRSDTQKRIQVLLGKNKSMNFSQLQKEIGISRPGLSRNLNALTKDNVIIFEKIGREKHYKLSGKHLEKFERQAELLSTQYTNHIFLSHPSIPPSIKLSPKDIFQEVSKNMTAYFLFLFLKSVQTGKNWMKAYDSNQINYGSADLMCLLLFGKDVHLEEIQWDLSKGWSHFFKKTNQMLKDKKNDSKIKELLKHLEEYYPNEYEVLEKFYSESQNK